MSDIIQKIQQEREKNKLLKSPELARLWLVDKIKTIKPASYNTVIGSKSRKFVNTPMVGKMYFFRYDPKLKEKLRYYDMFPIVIPIELYLDGFLGLNFHYLPPKERSDLLKQLMDFANNSKLTPQTKLLLSYKFLNGIKKYKAFSPCVKRYLDMQLQSPLVQIEAQEWDIAVLLPYSQFMKFGEAVVWKDSIKQIKKL